VIELSLTPRAGDVFAFTSITVLLVIVPMACKQTNNPVGVNISYLAWVSSIGLLRLWTGGLFVYYSKDLLKATERSEMLEKVDEKDPIVILRKKIKFLIWCHFLLSFFCKDPNSFFFV
jgi:hypothetical protein